MTTLTPSLLSAIMGCSMDRADECFPAMVQAMKQFNIDSSRRIRQFLTQVKWESGGLKYFAELASGEAYNGRKDLGNTQPGDGPRFKGSGPIQVTGRSNFTMAQEALNRAGIKIDILRNPDLARTVKYGFWISCWWWSSHGGNQEADNPDQYEAAIRCGRLVNRGNANSPYKAQDEAQRISAYKHVSKFGDLSLPNTPKPDPEPKPNPKPDRKVFNMVLVKVKGMNKWGILTGGGIRYMIDQSMYNDLRSQLPVTTCSREWWNANRAPGTEAIPAPKK